VCSKSPNIRGDRKEKIFKTTLASTAKAVNKMVASSNAAKTAGTRTTMLPLTLFGFDIEFLLLFPSVRSCAKEGEGGSGKGRQA
jgi:hypothetical protein